MKKIIKVTSAASALLATSAKLAFAAGPAATPNVPVNIGTSVPAAISELTIASLVSLILRLLVVVAALAFFFWLVLGGIRWITSAGDKAKTEEARAQITAALVGLVIVFAAWAVASLIKLFFNIDLFNLNLTNLG